MTASITDIHGTQLFLAAVHEIMETYGGNFDLDILDTACIALAYAKTGYRWEEAMLVIEKSYPAIGQRIRDRLP